MDRSPPRARVPLLPCHLVFTPWAWGFFFFGFFFSLSGSPYPYYAHNTTGEVINKPWRPIMLLLLLMTMTVH